MSVYTRQINESVARNRMDTLLPDCVLPGCRNPVAAIGAPCEECRSIFGDMLQHNPDGVPMTEDAIIARDLDTREMYVRFSRAVPIDEDEEEPDVGEPGERRVAECWLCDTETSCEWTDMGWECDTCRGEP